MGAEPMQVAQQVQQVAPVGPHGVRRQIPIAGQVVDIGVESLPQRWRQVVLGGRVHLPTVRVGWSAV